MPTSLRILAWLLVGGLTAAALAQGGGRQGGRPASGQEDKEEDTTGPRIVAIGELTPELSAGGWVNHAGTPRLERFRGRVVVLFFFRTDGASLDFIAPLNDLYKKFSRQGVVIVGLTPQKKELAERLIKDKEIKFVVGYGADVTERYEVSAFPRVYLLDTVGRLASRFHPADELETRLRTQLRRTPPTGADSSALTRRLEQARTALRDNKYGVAYTLAQDVTKLAERDSEPAKAAAELLKKIEDAARKWLDEAKAAAGEAGDPGMKDADKEARYDRASAILAELSVRFAGTDLGQQADDEIGRLMGDARLKTRLRTALSNARGQLLLGVAAEEEAGGHYLEALRLYRGVTEEFPDTEAAQAAGGALERLRSDPKLRESIKDARADDEAERWLDLADGFAKLEVYGKARELYERVVSQHGGTPAATRARERLVRLPEEEVEEVPPDVPDDDELPATDEED